MAVAARRGDPPYRCRPLGAGRARRSGRPALHNLALDARLGGERRRPGRADRGAAGVAAADRHRPGGRGERPRGRGRGPGRAGPGRGPPDAGRTRLRRLGPSRRPPSPGSSGPPIWCAALDALRDIAHGVYPPVLAARGLGGRGAGRRRALGLAIDLDISGTTAARYEPDLEASVYFCVVEAIQVLARAGATTATVVLSDGTPDTGSSDRLRHRRPGGRRPRRRGAPAVGGSGRCAGRHADRRAASSTQGTRIEGRVPASAIS